MKYKVPVQVGNIYKMIPEESDQWIQIYKIEGPYVYVGGVASDGGDTLNDIKVRKSRFHELVVNREDAFFARNFQLMNGEFLGLALHNGFLNLSTLFKLLPLLTEEGWVIQTEENDTITVEN